MTSAGSDSHDGGRRRAGRPVAAAGALSALVAAVLWRFGFFPWLIVGWLLAVGLLAASVASGEIGARVAALARRPRLWWVGAAALLLLPTVVRAAAGSLAFTHPDEFSLAWFSRQYHFTTSNFFGPMPPEPVWTFQSPSLFFVMQKIALAAIGTEPLDVKLSVLPWVVVTAVALFLSAKDLFGLSAAIVSVTMYAVLAPSVYEESFGVSNTMSTALLALFFLAALRNYRQPSDRSAVAVGVTCAFCYLAPSYSYAAAPLLLLFAVVALLHVPAAVVGRGLLISLGVSAVVLLPFVAGAGKSNNFFLDRMSHTVPIVGRVLGHDVPKEEVSRSLSQVTESWIANCAYFWRDNVGGTDGYAFGNRALLDPVSCGLALVGAVLSPLLALRRRELILVFLFPAVNILLVGFANPPPQITRLTILFPLVAMLMALPVVGATTLRRAPPALRATIAGALLLLAIGCNLRHLGLVRAQETNAGREDYEDVKVALYLKEHLRGREIRVAAFAGFHLEYTLRFFLPGARIRTDYHDRWLRAFDRHADCVYVILFPGEFNAKFAKADPEAALITDVSWKYGILDMRPAGGEAPRGRTRLAG